jgi:hypothetical protein
MPPVAVRSWRVDGHRLLAVVWSTNPPADAQPIGPGQWLALRWDDSPDSVPIVGPDSQAQQGGRP